MNSFAFALAFLAYSASFVAGQGNGCALIVSGPPKSSGFDSANHAFGGPPPPFSNQQTCITYDAVNSAFEQAKRTVGLNPVRGHFSSADVGNLGTVVHETSRNLAKQYGLSKDAVANGLPLIDTTKTIIENYCPPFLMTPTCKVERYRTITGLCNNLNMPHWGASMHGHHRFLAPDYADGISAPRYIKHFKVSNPKDITVLHMRYDM